MKTILLNALICCCLSLSSCLKPEEQQPNQQDTGTDTTQLVNSPLDLNALNRCLNIGNATSTTGVLPMTNNQVDFKIDKDTIYLHEGFTDRIHLQSAECYDEGISSLLIQVVGSDEFFNLRFPRDSLLYFKPPSRLMSDSLSCEKTNLAFELSMNCEEEQVPPFFDIDILPVNYAGNPVDIIRRRVVIPDPKKEVNCRPGPNDTWVWKWTTVNGKFHSSPGISETFTFDVNGCCRYGKSVDCISNFIPEEQWISMQYEHFRNVNMEYLTFNENGSMNGLLSLVIQNIDPGNSDFCSGRPAYNYNAKDHIFWGDYTFNAATRKLKFTQIESRMTMVDLGFGTYPDYDMHYISTRAEYEMIGCNMLVEKTNVEEGIGLRYFERLAGRSEEDVFDHLWTD